MQANPRRTRSSVLIAAMLPVLFVLLAQWGRAQPSTLQFSHLIADEGLGTGSVEAVYQDSYGYIWFGGTAGVGVVRYNGHDFTIYSHDKSDPNSISDGVVWDIFQDSHGDLYVATDVGINRYDYKSGQFTRFKPPLNDAFARAVVEDIHGTLWVGFIGAFARFDQDTGEFELYRHHKDNPQSLSSNVIRTLFAGRDGNVWIGTEGGGLSRFDIAKEVFEQYRYDPNNPNSIASAMVSGIHQTDDGIVWAGTSNGLSRLDPATGRFKTFRHEPANPHSLRNNIVGPIIEDGKGKLWIGTEGGLHYFDPETEAFTVHVADPNQPTSLAHNVVRSLHLDTNGGLWLGNFPSGISYLDKTSLLFSTYRHNPNDVNGLSQASVLSLQEDQDGHLLIGTDGGGLTHFNRETNEFKHYQHDPQNPRSLSADAVLTIMPAADQKWWVGAWIGALNLFDPATETFSHHRAPMGGASDHVWSVLEDSQGTVWVGTIGAGLARYEPEYARYTWYKKDLSGQSSFPSNVVWNIYEDHLGQIWIGTGDGLARYLPGSGSFVTYVHDADDPTSLSSNVVTDIAEDEHNRLWLGTRGGGLNLYDRAKDTFTSVGQEQGLASDMVVSVVPDGLGNIWMGTVNGLSRYTPATGQVSNFGYKNGLQGNEFNLGSGLRTSRGELVFGGVQGFTLFDPQDFQVAEAAPLVEIAGFEIFGEAVTPGAPDSPLTRKISHTDALTLTHDQSIFSFTFVALSYSDPDRNEYAYKLHGFEDRWNNVGNRRVATYTNLDPGTYTFQVKAANSQGVWNEEGRSIRVTVLPPPWKTWWAYTLYVLIFGASLFVFVRAQRKKVAYERSISKELEMKVAERTDALQQKNQQLRDAYARLEEVSLSDPLTGLNNRRYLQKLILLDVAKVERKRGQALNRKNDAAPGEDLIFLILDVDHFKWVNDHHGHAAGDQVLVQLSALLKDISRQTDFLIRWGGEEFLIVGRFTHRDDAPQMAERVRAAVESHQFTLPDGKAIRRTCSIGYAYFPFIEDDPGALTWEQVIDTADKALYMAKQQRNRSIGLAATSITPRDDLYRRLTDDVDGMIARGEIEVLDDQEISTPLCAG